MEKSVKEMEISWRNAAVMSEKQVTLGVSFRA